MYSSSQLVGCTKPCRSTGKNAAVRSRLVGAAGVALFLVTLLA
ncbi:MAG TPA: hypothetical protein VGE98_02535 [Thermoanaerobaculia bacterium]